jgi:hypothetical protein
MEPNIEKTQFDKTTIDQLQTVLKFKGFIPVVLNSDKEVKDFINNNIPDRCIIGLGDSITTCRLNIRNILAAKGSSIFYSWNGSETYNRSLDTFETSVRPDFFLTRINALTTQGEILIKDYSKKALETAQYPKHIFAFAGYNRITEAFNDGESRMKYPVFDKCPANIGFTVILLPTIAY